MSQSNILSHQEKQTSQSNASMVGFLILTIILVILYVSGIFHSFAMLFADKIKENKGPRVGLFVGSFLLPPPLYWIAFLIVKFAGGFSTA